ncbi:YesL family protein [Microbacterium aurantiacum]|uniref:YesL family protein n=1 Tax=Microbacterium aurantiacum TaxID=162393 RepID=UPI000C803D4A|nr:DUF624 domain-containing protein [Microbacterium aurantiacum]
MSTTAAPAGWAIRLHDAMDWIFWVARINVLWWLFTLAGAGVLGAAPASVAATTMTRQRLRGESVPLLRGFARTWKREFLRANATAGPAIWASTVLGVAAAGTTDPALRVTFLAAFVLAFANACVVIPLYAHYDVPLGSYISVAGRWSLRNIPHVLLLLLSAVVIVTVSSAVPGIVPFLTMGAWIVINTVLAVGFFTANDKRIDADLTH